MKKLIEQLRWKWFRLRTHYARWRSPIRAVLTDSTLSRRTVSWAGEGKWYVDPDGKLTLYIPVIGHGSMDSWYFYAFIYGTDETYGSRVTFERPGGALVDLRPGDEIDFRFKKYTT
jgi:hypothetical protein